MKGNITVIIMIVLLTIYILSMIASVSGISKEISDKSKARILNSFDKNSSSVKMDLRLFESA
jgi:hypothetical protein